MCIPKPPTHHHLSFNPASSPKRLFPFSLSKPPLHQPLCTYRRVSLVFSPPGLNPLADTFSSSSHTTTVIFCFSLGFNKTSTITPFDCNSGTDHFCVLHPVMESKNFSETDRTSTTSSNTHYQEESPIKNEDEQHFQMAPPPPALPLPPFSSPSDRQISTSDSQNFTSIPQHYQRLHHQPSQSQFYPQVFSPGFVNPSTFLLYPLMVDQNRADHGLPGGFLNGVCPSQKTGGNQKESFPRMLPELQLQKRWDSSISKAARSKRRMARQMSSNYSSRLGNLFNTSSSDRSRSRSRPDSSTAILNNKDVYTFITPDNKVKLKFILRKELKNSDVNSLGRIVLPKKDSEANLPSLTVKEGIQVAVREVESTKIWYMRYRFWPNNKSRMYLLENTGDFVRLNELKRGDFIMLYKDDKEQLYISSKKAKEQASCVPVVEEVEENERRVAMSTTKEDLSSEERLGDHVIGEEASNEPATTNNITSDAASTTQLTMGVGVVMDMASSSSSKNVDTLELDDSFFYDVDECNLSELERFPDFDDCDLSVYDDVVKDFNGR